MFGLGLYYTGDMLQTVAIAALGTLVSYGMSQLLHGRKSGNKPRIKISAS